MKGDFQLPLFEPKLDWRLPCLSELPEWGRAKRVAIDLETCDPDLVPLGPGFRRTADSYVCGIAVAIEDGPSVYLPVRHATGVNLPAGTVWAWMRAQAAAFEGELVNINLPYDLGWMAQNGVEFPKVKAYRDVGVAEALIWELHTRYSLNAIAGRRGFPMKKKDTLAEFASAYGWNGKPGKLGGFIHRVPPQAVADYATWDAELTLKILRQQERQLADEDLWDVWDLESDVLPVVVAMTRLGVRIEEQRLDEVSEWSLREERDALARVSAVSGRTVGSDDVWKAAALAPVLEAIGVDVPLTEKTEKPSVTAGLLASIDHDAARDILRARKVNKLRTTFCEGIRKRIVNGRIHCTFNQSKRDGEAGRGPKGARSGRFSAENPNLQQQFGSKEPELACLLRHCFVADEGKLWASLDYSQQEPRLAVHAAYLARHARRSLDARWNPGELYIRGAEEAVETYSDTTVDFHTATTHLIWGDDIPADQFSTKRRFGKDIFLGRCYGMGGGKFCRKAGFPTVWREDRRTGEMREYAGPEGQAVLDRFDAGIPWLKGLADLMKDIAQSRGRIRTILGRHVHFPPLASGGYDWAHKGLNGYAQGGAADQMKKAMVEIHRAGYRIQLTEHDEVDLSVRTEREADECMEIMRDCVKLAVPVVVTKCIGDSWRCSIEK